MHPSSCLWHMKWAIRAKLSGLRSSKDISMSETTESHLYMLVGWHIFLGRKHGQAIFIDLGEARDNPVLVV